jgi:hypothetical protein
MNPRVLAIAILLVVAVAVTVSLLVLDREDGGTDADQAPSDVAFDILDGECGYANVVTAQGSIPPQQGEFCLVRVTITNQGAEAARLDPSCQFLVSATGERYTPRPDVLTVDEASNRAFQAPIAPGQVVEDAGLYYDVPAGTNAASAEFHTACDREPIRVDL